VYIFVGECSLYSTYLVQSAFLVGVGTPFPYLFLALQPWI